MWELCYLKEFCAKFHKASFLPSIMNANPKAIHILGLFKQSPPVATLEKPEYRRPYALTRLELLMGGIFPWRAFLRLRFWIFIVQSWKGLRKLYSRGPRGSQ